jgi:hypothetical protein
MADMENPLLEIIQANLSTLSYYSIDRSTCDLIPWINSAELKSSQPSTVAEMCQETPFVWLDLCRKVQQLY